MKILFVTAEAYPYAKSGGLGDVAYALPKALKANGHDVRVVMPKYETMPVDLANQLTYVKSRDVSMNWRKKYAGLFKSTFNDLEYYFIDNEGFFKRSGYYGYFDDGERYAFFSKAVLDLVVEDEFIPDVIHINDWHTAPIALLVKDAMYAQSNAAKAKVVYSIHNLNYQGIFPKHMLSDFYGLSDAYLSPEGIEFNDNLNFMKMGIVYADQVTTVSESYAQEITYPFYGEKLEGVIAHKGVKGIVNGIDLHLYDPENDENVFENYNESNALEAKKENKRTLQRLLRLKQDASIPMVAMVTRLVDHKGIDLVLRVAEEIVTSGMQLVVLGTGTAVYEDELKRISSYHPNMLSVNIYFDHVMASRIYASADIFLMPSIIEPCGIGQLIALRYGAIPVVRQTGGLKDTIEAYNKYEDTGNGFGFLNVNAHDMLYTLKEAAELYRDKAKWENLIKRAMTTDVSWNKSALAYEKIYTSL